jgi:excisionase family DNA binding protein
MSDRPVTAVVPLAEADLRALATELAALIGEAGAAPLLCADQAGALLGVPASWLLAEARAGRVPHVRLGRYVRFVRSDLLDWVDERKQGPTRRLRRAA